MMNSLAENVLYIYLIVFISMLIFDIASIFYKKLSDRNMEHMMKKIKSEIDGELSTKVSSKHIKMLSKKLQRIGYFIAFTRVVDDMEDEVRKRYLTSIKRVFISILPHYEKEETIRQTYFIHFLSQYPYILNDKMTPIITYIIKCTTKDSVYLRENALNTLYSLGKTSYIKEAFYEMNYLSIRHHHKLITDGLLKYQGDKDELASMLIHELKNYDEEYKVACINYFAYQKIDCKEYIYNILTSPIEYKEVKIACIRYFSRIYYEPVIETLYDLLSDDKNNWEYSAIAATALQTYPNKKTREMLAVSTKSHNWYVRNNAARSLIGMTEKSKIEKLIDSTDDRYAKEALSYQLHLLGGES